MSLNKEIKEEQEDNKAFRLYTLAELAYQKQFENSVSDKENIYPEGWYSTTNYKLKTEIIAEALKNNTLIEKTTGYQELVEGVHMKVLTKE